MYISCNKHQVHKLNNNFLTKIKRTESINTEMIYRIYKYQIFFIWYREVKAISASD